MSEPENQAETPFARGILRLRQGLPELALHDLATASAAAPNEECCRLAWIEALAQSGAQATALDWLSANPGHGMRALLTDHFRRAGQFNPPRTRPTRAAPPSAALLRRCDQLLARYNANGDHTLLPDTLALCQAHPRDVFGWKLLGALCLRLGLRHCAQVAMQQALATQENDPEPWNNLGNLFRQTDRLAEARQCLTRALQLRPEAASIHLNLGSVLNSMDSLDDAEACFRQALRLRPQSPEAQNNLSNTLRRQERHEEAALLLEQLLASHPHFALGWNNLGCVLRDQGRLPEAVAALQRARALAPEEASIALNLVATQLNLGEFEQAEPVLTETLSRWPLDVQACRLHAWLMCQTAREQHAFVSYARALALAPGRYPLLLDLGSQLLDLARPAEAENILRQALAQRPDDVVALNLLSRALRMQERTEEAEAPLRQALALQPQDGETLANLGIVRADLNDPAQAESYLRQAISTSPAAAHYHVYLADFQMMQGQRAQAEASVDRALALAPDSPQMLSSIMIMLSLSANDPRLASVETLYAQRARWALPVRARFSLALGKAREIGGDAAAAFAAYAEGNALLARLQPFDAQQDQQLFDTIARFYDEALFAKWASALAAQADSKRVPVFIVGMPRSGSTLVEQILAAHPGMYGAGESLLMNPIAAQASELLHASPTDSACLESLHTLSQDYLRRLWRLAPDAPLISDKMPENFFHLGLIALLWPQARIIHCERSPLDTCFSCFTTPFRVGHGYSTDQTALAGRYLRYRQLMRHWEHVLPPGRMLTVRYETLLEAPQAEIGRMLDFLGLPWHDDCLRFHQVPRLVLTASQNQVRRPLYRSSVGRWRPFAPWLEPMRTLLAEQEAAWTTSVSAPPPA